ncbi:MAG: DUF5060 domain-containing protein, partial [Planctomycetota bacterium]|nr:DUF5060 domain-containing protein [Planctomycetota bacterium]
MLRALIFVVLVLLPSFGSAATYQESGGLVVMEYENATSSDMASWSLQTEHSGATGGEYLEWKHGNSSTTVDQAGSGVLTWSFTIAKTGDYQLLMRSWPSHNTEHNDVWVDFPDAQSYKVKTSGSAGDLNGWTKMYNNGGGTWGWSTNTVDNNSHRIWVSFPTAGTYTFRTSGRSTKFSVDRIVLRHSSVSENAAKDTALAESATGASPPSQDGDGSVAITGIKQRWHKVTLDMQGPWADETTGTNPFTDYRMTVTFTKGSLVYTVPGYFAADG